MTLLKKVEQKLLLKASNRAQAKSQKYEKELNYR